MANYNLGLTAQYGFNGKWENFYFPTETIREASRRISDLHLKGYRSVTCEIVDSEGEVIAYYSGAWNQAYFGLLAANGDK